MDGALVASAASAHAPNPSRPLRVAAGANERAADYLLPGRVDEVAVYPAALNSTRVRAHFDAAIGSSGSGVVEHVLIEDWCQQFTTGSSGGLAFGPDGELYMTAGSGGSYTSSTTASAGSRRTPAATRRVASGRRCRRRPLKEGGSGARISERRATQSVSAGPDPGRSCDRPGNAEQSARREFRPEHAPNRRLGFRNPFRIAVRPGTRDVWIGDVGAGAFEEINRVPDPIAAVRNFGWPCYEGTSAAPGSTRPTSTSVRTSTPSPGAVTPPFFAFQHGQKVVPTETCSTTTGSAVSGFAFTPRDQHVPGELRQRALLCGLLASLYLGHVPGRERHPESRDRDALRPGRFVSGRPPVRPRRQPVLRRRCHGIDPPHLVLRRQPATRCNCDRRADERCRSADRELQRLGLERPGRNDRLLRVGPRR